MTIEVLDLPVGQEHRAQALFSAVFGHEISPAHWEWKYRQGPRLGSVNIVARGADGELVGHAGAMVFEGRCLDRTLPMAQVCDIMVHRHARGGLDTAGVYPRLITQLRQALCERFDGVYAYGFPGVRPFRLGERMGFYRQIYRCRMQRLTAQPALGWQDLLGVVEPSPWDWSRIERVQARLGSTCAAPEVVRTVAYLDWRYRMHPSQTYRLWILRRRFRDVGWLVTRTMPDGEVCVVDAQFQEPPGDESVVALLWRALVAQGESPPSMMRWLPVDGGALGNETPIVATEFLVTAWHDHLPPPRLLPGDTDVY